MTREGLGMRVLMGFALWGMAEIAAFVVVGAWIGVLGVMALVLGTGVLGVSLMRRQGLQALRVGLRVETLGAQGLVMLGGLLLVLPGLLTDVVGALLLVPVVRRVVAGWLAARFQPVAEDDVLEGVAVEVEAPRLGSVWTER